MLSRDEIFVALQENLHLISEDTRGQEISEDVSLAEYGTDSLELIEVASRTMKQLNVKVPRTEISKIDSIGELVTLFEKAAQKN
ncbi:phosphopantetheine-binding protein [Actinomadura sp. 3N407]|uniref:phosphopantetheine-binding protein n=1 Tax=Actinomadura sp. 3N407 TaxID=3457423 RepID=UPI003FCEDBF6